MLWIRAKSRVLCNSWRFCILTTILTFYALFGDDFRLAVTPRSTDILFNILTIFCILVFSVECIAASLGQEEYFLGFFFWLDFGSTVTLLFDLTWIGDSLFCGGGEGGSALRMSRAGRAGARASRTVRIIRLMRLVKLYKTYRSAVESKRKAAQDSSAPGSSGPDEESLLDSEDGDEELEREEAGSGDAAGPAKAAEKEQPETRVGKKLSDMTTRRVIILVLVMLLIMPYFSTDTHGKMEFRVSASMGAELVYNRWRSWCELAAGLANSTQPWCLQESGTPDGPSREARHHNRAMLEETLLAYLYGHHSGDFAWHLYWVGLNSTSLVSAMDAASFADRQKEAAEVLGRLAQLNQERFLGESVIPSDDLLHEWDAQFANPSWQLQITALPGPVKQRLTKPWVERCQSHVGVKLQTEDGEVVAPGGCSIYEELRCSEVEYYMPISRSAAEGEHISILFAFDSRGTKTLEAGLGMLQTVFICLAVGIGAMTFSKDANELLLNPIERMIAKMETIKDNPLEAMRLGDLEYRREEIELAKRKEQLASMSACWRLVYRFRYMRKTKEPMETAMLEKTIIKLGGLLALGFGEAGAEIIGQNMKGGVTAGVNAMVPGQKVDAIIGFCSIRHFSDATEVLKEKVMLFVNQVGEIVHGCVDDYHGAPNKNIGHAFLLIWRLGPDAVEKQRKLADMSMMSFVRIVAEINKSRVLAAYRGHPGLLQRLPKFRVQMGFGLHCGWAIEGAIGSEFKIDASYLSPNVNVASQLEGATEHFGVWMLLSHFMIELCTREMGQLCRLIDHVVVRGSRHPLRLYTIDLDCMSLKVVLQGPERVIKNRFKIRQLREVRKTEKWADDYSVHDAFRTDEDLLTMRAQFSLEFFQRFSMAYRNYEAGEWKAARDMLLTCHYMPKSDAGRFVVTSEAEWPEDGPTLALLRFMRRTQYCPPKDWPGHRDLEN